MLAPVTRVSRWSAPAWAAIAATAAFVGITCWWLTRDRGIPIYDAGIQLETAIEYHNMLAAGSLLAPLEHASVYPVLAHLVGALGMFLGGVNVAAPIVAENVVFVPLLALGCYQTGRLLFGPAAGMLAVLFVLGSPLIGSLFHVFLLDAPLAAAVSVSVWLILASEDFARVEVCGVAGLAVGLSLNVKVTAAQFLIGLVAVVLLHGGWRNWRGFAVFAGVALLLGAPWYVLHLSEFGRIFEIGSSSPPGTPPGNVPPTLTLVNFTWYFWSVLNSQLLAPLFALVLGGALWMIVTQARGAREDRAVRSTRVRSARLELLVGAFAAWAIVTLTPHHDIRYGLPLIPFLAVIATGWIVCLPRAARVLALTVLALGVGANTLGVSFGVGHEVKVGLVARLPGTEQAPDRIVLSSTDGFLAGAPSRDGDVPELLAALRRSGVHVVALDTEQGAPPDFSYEGLVPLTQIAKLSRIVGPRPEFALDASVVTLIHGAITGRTPASCTRLSDGTGVWVVRFDAAARRLALYCPTHTPRFYDPGVVGALGKLGVHQLRRPAREPRSGHGFVLATSALVSHARRAVATPQRMLASVRVRWASESITS